MALLILAICRVKDVVDLNRLIYLLLAIQFNRLTVFWVPLLLNPQTRQDYKDTRRFPLEAPSCALLFRPCRLPDTCSPFSLREAWRFLIAHAVGISVRCRSFAPSWAVCTAPPPFSLTAAPYPVTIVLSPTR